MQVSPFRRGKELTCIYTDERRDLCRELPNWMFDERYCAGMSLGAAEISLGGLNELAIVLALIGANRKRGAKSLPSRKKEVDRAENRRHDRAQLVLKLERRSPQTAEERNPNGVVEALADLLLEALIAETKLGGVDESQDHA